MSNIERIKQRKRLEFLGLREHRCLSHMAGFESQLCTYTLGDLWRMA